MKTYILSLGLLLTTLTTACGSDESLDLETEFRTSFGCGACGYTGSNSPRFNQYPIHTLGLEGQMNADGITVLGVRSPSQTLYQLKAEGDELFAWDGSTIAAMGAGLIGWTILLRQGAELLEIQVLDHTGTMASWAAGAAPISAYALGYYDPEEGEIVNLCPGATIDETAVTVLRDVVYDEEAHEVHDEQGWMTLACFGNAAAKMKLMGYGRHSQHHQGSPATEAQRKATIRMITADYCGIGISFTAQGTLLDWLNALGTVTPQHDPDPSWENVEAIWDENGALCLSTPRLADLAEVEAYCNLPPCEEIMLQGPHEWVTWVVP